MRLAPFDGCFLKILRGRNHVSELKNIMAAYGGRLKAVYVPLDADPSQSRLTFSETPPPEIALVLGDAVHNFRAALDIMICDVARLQGKSSDKLKFPFAANATEYEDRLRGEIRRLGPDVRDALRELAPYKGGNIALRGLHDLDILDKHELVIPVMPCVWSRFDIASFTMAKLAQQRPGAEIPRIAFLGDYGETMRTLDVEGSIVPTAMVEEMADHSKQEDGAITALFADGLPFARTHVIETLENLAEVTLQIVKSFHGKFGGGNLDSSIAPGGNN